MEIEILSENTTALIRPKTSLEDPNPLKEVIEKFKSSGYRYILLDLLNLNWMASTEIGVLVQSFKILAQVDTQLILLVSSPVLMDTLQTTNIDQLISIYESREQALEMIESEMK